MILPGNRAPELKIQTVSNEIWDLHKLDLDKYLMLVFYRGFHCPICKKYLKELSSLTKQFNKQGVLDIIAISGDNEEKAIKAKDEWQLRNIEVGFDLSVQSMKDWGLFISESIKDQEPKIFSEPGLFLVDKNHTIFYSALNSMPFGRPQFADLLQAMTFINENDYPARGGMNYDSIPALEEPSSSLHYQ